MFKTLIVIACFIASVVYWKDISPWLETAYNTVDETMLTIHETFYDSQETTQKVK